MTKHVNETFNNSIVELDGNEFEGCTFNSCTFNFRGKGGFNLAHNKFNAPFFAFHDHAALTVEAMRAIYSMGDAGKDIIRRTFDAIAPDLKKVH